MLHGALRCGDDERTVAHTSGVKSGPFPYTISIRFQDDETIIFDDLLSMRCAPVCGTHARLRSVPRSVVGGPPRALVCHPIVRCVSGHPCMAHSIGMQPRHARSPPECAMC